MPYIDMGRILREKERTARKARELKGQPDGVIMRLAEVGNLDALRELDRRTAPPKRRAA